MKKILSVVLACIMLVSVLASCGGSEGAANSDGTVTIRVFDKNSGSKDFDDEVAKYITEKTGVKLEIESPTGDPSEKLNLMLSGQNYPDIVLMGQGEIVNRYIEAGALIELDNLIDRYGDILKKVKEQFP